MLRLLNYRNSSDMTKVEEYENKVTAVIRGRTG